MVIILTASAGLAAAGHKLSETSIDGDDSSPPPTKMGKPDVSAASSSHLRPSTCAPSYAAADKKGTRPSFPNAVLIYSRKNR